MIELNARYDGKVIVPERPLPLPANQRVRIHVEPIDAAQVLPARVDLGKLRGIGLRGPLNPSPRFADDKAL